LSLSVKESRNYVCFSTRWPVGNNSLATGRRKHVLSHPIREIRSRQSTLFSSGISFSTQNSKAQGMSFSDKLGAAVFLLMSGVTFGLGTWQAKRYNWKVDLIAKRTNKLNAEEILLPSCEQNKYFDAVEDEWMYRRVRCKGVFDFSKSILLGPRAPPLGTEILERSAVSPSGYFLITPLVQENGETVLVNQGWIPKNYVDDETGKVGEEMIKKLGIGSVDIVGVVAPTEFPGQFTPSNMPEKRKFFWLDIAEMKRICDAPRNAWFIDRVESDKAPSNYAYPAPRPIESYMNFKVNPYTHIGYSATWYGLCLTGIAVTRFRFLK